MQSDYISRQAALDSLGATKNATKYGGDHSGYETRMLYEIHDALTGIPAADVVPVVRCRECKHAWSMKHPDWQEPVYICTRFRSRWNPDDFCSRGERKE